MYGFGLFVGIVATMLLVAFFITAKDDPGVVTAGLCFWILMLFSSWLIFKDYKDWTIIVEKDPVQE